jgi:hypothetical protein
MSSNEAAGLITVRGERFLLDGRELVPNGVNSYPLLQHAGNERWDAVDDIFGQARALGRPFVRTNAFGADPIVPSNSGNFLAGRCV